MDFTTALSSSSTMSPPASSIPNSALRRPKAQLSCNTCRRKKIKCDRMLPCTPCSKVDSATCVYPDVVTKVRRRKRPIDDKIDRLEKLVNAIVSTGQSRTDIPASTPTNTFDAVTQRAVDEHEVHDVGEWSLKLHGEGEERRFINATHWENVLTEIASIKEESRQSVSSSVGHAEESSGRPLLLLHPHRAASRDELVCSVPSRPSVDILVELFASDESSPSLATLVHMPSLHEQCQLFWKNPTAVSLSWLALLYAIMALALQTAIRKGVEIDDFPLLEASSHLFALRGVQCLIESDYTKPKTYTIEAMTLYLASEHHWSIDGYFSANIILAIIIRLAIQMGYHRDPNRFPNMSVLDAEMRRRVWAFLVQIDIVLAEKCGQPRIIDESQTDTLPPTGFVGEDQRSETFASPSAKTPDDQDVIHRTAFMAYKMRLIAVQGRITDRINSPQGIGRYNEVLQLDHNLALVVQQSRPVWLQPVDLSQKFPTLSSGQLNEIIEMDLILRKAQMILHRKWLVPSRTCTAYSYSRQICLEAAVQVIRYQHFLSNLPDSPTSPDGSRRDWRFLALMNHDFLLAAMLLCLDLDQTFQQGDESVSTVVDETLQMQQSFMLLKQSYQAWTSFIDRSTTAAKGAQAVGMMLARLRPHESMLNPIDIESLSVTDEAFLGARRTSDKNSITQGYIYPPLATTSPTAVGYGSPSVASRTHHIGELVSAQATNSHGRAVNGVNSRSVGYSQDSDEQLNNMLNSIGVDMDWEAWDSQYLQMGNTDTMVDVNGLFGV